MKGGISSDSAGFARWFAARDHSLLRRKIDDVEGIVPKWHISRSGISQLRRGELRTRRAEKNCRD